jgi:glycosyltransferase involved in cell wall biosynthesis
MAYARPPIASAIGGLIEVVDDGVSGWLVPPDRADLLASKLQTIIENPATWRAFGSQARARYDLMFSDRSVSDAMKAVLQIKLSKKMHNEAREANPPVVSDVV